MIDAQQFERIQSLAQPMSAIAQWLLPKTLKCLLVGVFSVAWLVFYVLQFWTWHYAWLIPLALLALPLLILAIWSLLLWDLGDLPQALEDLKQGITGLKGKITSDQKEAAKTVVRLSSTRKLPSLLTELWSLVQGIDSLRTIVAHVIFLANPISWLLLVLSCLAVSIYAVVAIVTGMVWLF